MRSLRPRRPQVWRWALPVLLLLGVAAAGGAAYLALTAAADDLAVVRAELESAVDLADSGDVPAADEAFDRAEAAAADAVGRVHSPPVRLVGFLPTLDVTVDSVVASTEAAHLIARAGGQLMDAVADIPGGLDALTLGGGGQSGWLQAAQDLQQPLVDANAMLTLALTLVEEAPASTRFAQVDEARRLLADELGEVVPAIDDIAAMVEVLPELFGAQGERRYFLGAQNPAELRGTGGLIGAYAILTASDGEIEISPFSPIQTLPLDLFSEDVAPSEDFVERYELVIAGLGTWLNVNFSPDFPAVAQTIEAMYREAEGIRLDGVMLVDPFALQSLLTATGPVTVPDPEVGVVEADTVVDYVVNEAPLALGLGGERKEILGEAARAVLDEFLSGDVPGRRRIEALADAVSGGHVLVHAASPQVQAALSRIGVTGELPAPDQAVLGVAINNTALSKADYWLEQRLDWTITLDPDGTASATAVLELTNGIPADPGIPRYIAGAGAEGLAFGESWPFTTLLCGTCDMLSVRYDDPDGFGAPVDTEAGHTLVDVRPRLAVGETVRVEYRMELPDAWRRSGAGGVMNLVVWTPPQINPMAMSVQVEAPSGWRWTDPGEPTTVESGVLVVQDVPGGATLGPFELAAAP